MDMSETFRNRVADPYSPDRGWVIIDPTLCVECSSIVESATVVDGQCETCWVWAEDLVEDEDTNPDFEPWDDSHEYTYTRDHQLI